MSDPPLKLGKHSFKLMEDKQTQKVIDEFKDVTNIRQLNQGKE